MISSNCRACHAPIIWTVTAARAKKMPVDADPMDPMAGGFRLSDDETPVATFVSGVDAEREGLEVYRSHFMTCPDAKRFRR